MSKKQTGLGTAAFFDKPAKQSDSTPVSQRSGNPTPLGKYIDGGKDKATYYLSPETMEAIDDHLPRLKRLAGEQRKLVTKSLVVEAALQAVFADLEANGTDSIIAKKMSEL